MLHVLSDPTALDVNDAHAQARIGHMAIARFAVALYEKASTLVPF